jgi:hypothetical protein
MQTKGCLQSELAVGPPLSRLYLYSKDDAAQKRTIRPDFYHDIQYGTSSYRIGNLLYFTYWPAGVWKGPQRRMLLRYTFLVIYNESG